MFIFFLSKILKIEYSKSFLEELDLKIYEEKLNGSKEVSMFNNIAEQIQVYIYKIILKRNIIAIHKMYYNY